MIKDLYYRYKLNKLIRRAEYSAMIDGEEILDLYIKIKSNRRQEFASLIVCKLKEKFGQDFIFEIDNNECLIHNNKILASTLIQNVTLYSLDDIEFLLNEGDVDYDDFKILCVRLSESRKLVSCLRYGLYRSNYKYSKFLYKFKKELRSELVNESLLNKYYDYYNILFGEDLIHERDK